MKITTELIKSLRDETGVSVEECKKALVEALGDKNKALAILKKKSGLSAKKKEERELSAGAASSYIHSGGVSGAMIFLSCETDFVAKNEEFKKLAYDIAMQVAATSPESVEALLESPFIKDGSLTIKGLIDGYVQKFGERIKISNIARFPSSS